MIKFFKIQLLLLFLFVQSSNAQFINLQLTIEPELSASVVSDLNFGQLVVNSGERNIELGDPSMGIFSVTGFKNQRVYLNVQFPDALVHQNPAISNNIPISLNLAVNNTGVNDYKASFPIQGDNVLVNLHEYASIESYRSSKGVWETMYIYVYGSLDIGSIPNGIYDGQIFLYVEYD